MGRSTRVLSGRALLVLVSLSLAACSRELPGEPSAVVATVNDTEITAAQIRSALRSRGVNAADSKAVRQTIEQLIDEQLLYNEAVNAGLDREPAVRAAAEQARRQAIANAYVERMVLPAKPIDVTEQLQYYEQHPALFAERKLYQLVAYSFNRSELTDSVREQLENARSVDEINTVLSRNAVVYESQTVTRAAEQLPLNELPRFASAQPGDLIILEPRGETCLMMFVVGMTESPIGTDQALPLIRQYLANTRKEQVLRAHLERARASARVAYVADVDALSFDTDGDASMIAQHAHRSPKSWAALSGAPARDESLQDQR